MMGDTAAFTVTKENVEDDRALLQVNLDLLQVDKCFYRPIFYRSVKLGANF